MAQHSCILGQDILDTCLLSTLADAYSCLVKSMSYPFPMTTASCMAILSGHCPVSVVLTSRMGMKIALLQP